VHVNRAPLSGRVVAIERGGSEYLAAFHREAADRNVCCTMTCEMASGETFRVVQISGLIARRILCFPQVGEWLARGTRYGYIRFGSRTDVWLPLRAVSRVRPGDRVKGGSSVLARLEDPA
jgi:phosphatidylserine decarboxylase